MNGCPTPKVGHPFGGTTPKQGPSTVFGIYWKILGSWLLIPHVMHGGWAWENNGPTTLMVALVQHNKAEFH
jgi:hypothetical protein